MLDFRKVKDYIDNCCILRGFHPIESRSCYSMDYNNKIGKSSDGSELYSMTLSLHIGTYFSAFWGTYSPAFSEAEIKTNVERLCEK